MSRVLHFEQEGSLVKRLEEAGIEHGDTATVTLEGVGVRRDARGTPSIAFCPTTVSNVNILRKGTQREREKKISAVVCVSKRLRNRILGLAPEHGFVDLRLIVHGNGVLQLNGRVLRSERVPATFQVHQTTSYSEYKGIEQLVAH